MGNADQQGSELGLTAYDSVDAIGQFTKTLTWLKELLNVNWCGREGGTALQRRGEWWSAVKAVKKLGSTLV